MKKRVMDFVMICFLAIIAAIPTLISNKPIGGDSGRIVFIMGLLVSFYLSWRLSGDQNKPAKFLIYIYHACLLALLSGILIDLFAGITMGFYFNIFLFVVFTAIYYFQIFKKMLVKTNTSPAN